MPATAPLLPPSRSRSKARTVAHGCAVLGAAAALIGVGIGAGARPSAAEGTPPVASLQPVAVKPVAVKPVAVTPVDVKPGETKALTMPSLPAGVADKLAPFIAALWPDAERRGVTRALFDRVFAGLEPDATIFELLANQPEHVAAPWDYMARLVSEQRLETGRVRLAEHAALLADIEARYGVDRHIVLAIWGIESAYGIAPGTRNVVRSLATLAIGEPRRPQFWRGELLTALVILQRGDIAPELMTGSWAGAMGHTQFMPSSYMAQAVDHDGDGRHDIWGSVPDGLASAANYLRTAGWRTGLPWGFEVVRPAGFDHGLAGPEAARAGGDWQHLGIATPAGRAWPVIDAPLYLVAPAGARGPAFLVTPNFKAILKYNNAVAYALAVSHLADRLAGGAPIAGLWPTDDPPLGRAEREELQRRLTALGLDAGGVDGIIGAQTRRAVRAWQRRQGLAADGYAGFDLLRRVREASLP